MTATPAGLTLVVVTDDATLVEGVHGNCPSPHRVETFTRAGLVDERHALSAQGDAIVQAAAGADVLLIEWAMSEAPALNVLCYHVRRSARTPVLMIASAEADERAACIAAGADDAVSLPLSPAYLQARVFSYHRLVRAAQAAAAAQVAVPLERDVRRFGALRIDRTAHRFFVHDAEVELTPREFGLIDYLVSHADTLCTRDQILDHVWGITFDTGTNMVDVYMYFLRKKLEAYGLKGMIETVRGKGYRLVQP